MAKQAGKRKLKSFFKMNDDEKDDEFNDNLLDDDDDFDDDDDYYDDEDDDDDDYYPRKSKKSSFSKASAVSQSYGKSSQRGYSQSSSMNVRPQTKSSGRLVEFNGRKGIKSSMNGEVFIIKPKDIEDTDTIVDNLLDGYVVIINLEGVELTTAQRIVDFVGGATKAIDGSIVAVTGNIFVATAQKDSVIGDIREEILNGSINASHQVDINY